MALFTAKASATGNSPQLAHPAGTETARAAPASPAGQAVRSAASTATELGVSVKTVGFHLRRIFGKLGI